MTRASPPDWRALCERLVQALLIRGGPWLGSDAEAVLREAKAALRSPPDGDSAPLTVELSREVGGRWIAEATWVPGALAYGANVSGALLSISNLLHWLQQGSDTARQDKLRALARPATGEAERIPAPFWKAEVVYAAVEDVLRKPKRKPQPPRTRAAGRKQRRK